MGDPKLLKYLLSVCSPAALRVTSSVQCPENPLFPPKYLASFSEFFARQGGRAVLAEPSLSEDLEPQPQSVTDEKPLTTPIFLKLPMNRVVRAPDPKGLTEFFVVQKLILMKNA